jgi:paraquat-inducible protein B
VSGLETLLGPRHLEVDPGPAGSKPESQFNGLDRAPLRAGRTFRSGTDQETVNDDSGAPARGLELVLQAGRLGSITATSPVLFRGVRVGSVTGVRLAEDARTVDLTILVEPQYGRLVKSNTRFWNAGGLGVDFGLIHGLTVNAKSIESLITGGVEFATPNKPGDAVEPGHRFKLEDEPEKAWLEWAPPL